MPGQYVTITDGNAGYNAMGTYQNPLYFTHVGNIQQQEAGCGYFTVPAGKTTDTQIKTTTGVFFGVIITGGVGLGTPTFHDSLDTTGPVVGLVPASSPLGLNQDVPSCGIRFTNGLTLAGNAANPAMTVLLN